MSAEAAVLPTGRGGLRLALSRLRRNPAAWGSSIVLLAILIACFPGAPVWVHVACGHGPNDQNIQGYVHDGGHRVPVVRLDGTPIGPGLRACYLLGADSNGRDLMVRLLYGGRVSLEVGISSAVVCVGMALVLALMAGYRGGATDASLTVPIPTNAANLGIGQVRMFAPFEGVNAPNGSFLVNDLIATTPN